MESLALMPKYEDYVDSGVEWLGDIPASWSLLANKHIFRLKKKQVGKRSNEYDLLSLTLRGVIKRDMENPEGKFPAEFDTYQEVQCGDFIFCLFDVEETPRTVGLSPFNGMITGAYTVFESNDNFDNRFLYYFYLNLDAKKRLKPLYRGLRNTIPKDSFLSFKTFIPPQEQQTRIANFLDKKTAQIGEAIAIKEQQISLLKERKQIIIQQAVTQGLDPNVPMKDSGVDWIGKIPAHWETVRSRWLFKQRREKARKEDEQLTASQKYGVISQQQYMELEGRRVTQVEFNSEILKHVEANDFVISMRSFQGGIEFCPYTGCVSSAYVPLIPNSMVYAPYFKHLLKSSRYIEALQSTSNLVRDGQALRYENFCMVDLLIVPEEEQVAIAKYIDDQNSLTEMSTIQLEAQIERLKEYKTTLINSAVTGKIKIIPEMVEQ
ncbi:restriction endonuclease subunit S [Vibrio vulnificus]|uniref:restriction endonuclease subunit S n=1 Tax=Vibrio vulnificus TaxID=672 RepID=UPI001CDBCF34|nr:restriction endonuclease subunit S [Vibrio vulnificus]MCA4014887.1 restriction endonuclease subunit S [Vibrio vulnificus]